jgi:hypothetical protein
LTQRALASIAAIGPEKPRIMDSRTGNWYKLSIRMADAIRHCNAVPWNYDFDLSLSI